MFVFSARNADACASKATWRLSSALAVAASSAQSASTVRAIVETTRRGFMNSTSDRGGGNRRPESSGVIASFRASANNRVHKSPSAPVRRTSVAGKAPEVLGRADQQLDRLQRRPLEPAAQRPAAV